MWSDVLVQKIGVCYGGGYESAANAADFIAKTGIRNYRMGRVEVSAPTTQRAVVAALVAGGAKKLIGICDDYGSPTPSSRLSEMVGHWASAGVSLLAENVNEAQRQVGKPADWLATIASNGASSLDTNLGINEVKRQMPLLWTASAGTYPVLGPSMATKNKHVDVPLGAPGWYTKLGDVSAWCDRRNLHCYMGGNSMLKNGEVQKYWDEMITSFGATPGIMTETGFHDDATVNLPGGSTGNHKHTPISVQNVYMPRGAVELSRMADLEFFCMYEAVDDTSTAGYEQHFGLATGMGSTVTLKAPAASLKALIDLMADAGTTYTPANLPVTFLDAAGTTNRRFQVYGKRTGEHLVAIWREMKIWNPGFPGSTVSPAVTDGNVTVALPPGRTVTRYRPSATGATGTGMGSSGTYTVAVGADVVILKVAP